MKKYTVSIFLFLVIVAVYSYKLFSSFDFHPDFARDIYDLLFIVRGKLSLIGPKTSFGGIYNGPYYYYLFAPIFYLTKLNIYSLLIFNIFLFLLGLIFFHIHILKKYGLLPSILSTLLIALLPFYLINSRMPWNGSTYLPLLLIFLTLLYFYDFKGNRISLFLLGFLAGVIINFDLVISFILIFVIVYLLYFLKRKVDIIYFFIGFALTFFPLVLFELRHNFIMFKNTFLIGTYKNISVEKSTPITKFLSSQLGINHLAYILTFAALLIKSREKRSNFFIAGFFALLAVYAFIFRDHLAPHYLFPLSLFAAFGLITAILNTKKTLLLIIGLILVILSFPKNIYNYVARKPEKYEKTVKFILDNKLIQKDDSFNLIQYSKDYKLTVPVGHEYRFFFTKYGIKPKSEFEYNISDTLLIFSEVKTMDPTKLNSWELNQFGKINLKKTQKYEIGDIILYKISKTI